MKDYQTETRSLDRLGVKGNRDFPPPVSPTLLHDSINIRYVVGSSATREPLPPETTTVSRSEPDPEPTSRRHSRRPGPQTGVYTDHTDRLRRDLRHC